MAWTSRRAADPGVGFVDRVDAGVARDVDAVAVELGVHERAELGVDGGKHLGELLDLGDGEAAGGERLGHLEADVAGADDHRSPDLPVLEGAHQRERVAHRVQQVHAVGRAEAVEPGDRRPDRHRAGADDQRVVVERLVVAVGAASVTRWPSASMRRATVSSRSVMPVASRSAMVRCARLRQSPTSPET